MTLGRLMLVVAALGVLVVVAKGCSSDPPPFGAMHALTMCQMTLKRVALDPENADIPYVERFGEGDEYYFAWGSSTKAIHMRNRLGLDAPVSASCIVDGRTESITSLTLNGETLIGK